VDQQVDLDTSTSSTTTIKTFFIRRFIVVVITRFWLREMCSVGIRVKRFLLMDLLFLRIARILLQMGITSLMGLLTSVQVSYFSSVDNNRLTNAFTENDWGPAKINITQVGNFTKAPYKYKLTPLKSVEKIVKAGAGLGKI
jgi:hypothetical protein